MKKYALTIATLAVGLSTGCMPENNTNLHGGKSTAPPLRFVVTQPASPEAAKEIVAALGEPLTAIAKASNGATVPIPEIRILRGNGKDGLITVTGAAASGLGVVLFGDQTPSAKKELLSNTLAALESALRTGATGKPVEARVIKEAAQGVFRSSGFTAFIAAGGGTLWESKDTGPTTVLDDSAAFAQKVAADQSGGFLVLTDSTGLKVAEEKTLPETDAIKREPESQAKATAKVNTDKKVDAPQQSQPTVPPVPQRDNINIGIHVTAPEHPGSENQSASPSISLPQGVELVGDAIAFDTNSSKLTNAGRAAVKRDADLLKKQGDVSRLRLFLVARADYRGDEDQGQRLSQRRAEVVQAALLSEGISVERIIAIGEALSPDYSPKSELAKQRVVEIYLLPTKVSVVPEQTKPIAQRTR